MGHSSAPMPACMPAADLEFAQKLCANWVVDLSSNLNSNHRAFQRHKCSSVIDVFATAGHTFLSPLFRAHGPIDIDLMRTFCCLRKNADIVRLDFSKSPRHGEKKPPVRFTISDLSDTQLGEKGRVPRQHAKITF